MTLHLMSVMCVFVCGVVGVCRARRIYI